MTALRDRQDMTDPWDNADMIEPRLATEPIDNTDPIEPMDSTDPFDPMHRIEFSERMDHKEPRLADTGPSCPTVRRTSLPVARCP